MKKYIVPILVIIIIIVIGLFLVRYFHSFSFYIDKFNCQLKGGSIRSTEMTNYCVFKYKDGGKVCTNSSECLGGCVTDKFSQLGKSGICRLNNDNQGCFTEIEKTKIRCVYDDVMIDCPDNATNFDNNYCRGHE